MTNKQLEKECGAVFIKLGHIAVWFVRCVLLNLWFVTRETSSGLWVSLLTVSSYLPQFVISFFAGVWADS